VLLNNVNFAGPSGVGKTTLARRFAYDCRQHFKLITVSCSDLIHKVVGDSERKISELFSAARKTAPTLILLENIDILLGNAAAKEERAASLDNERDINGSSVFKFPASRTNDKTIDRFLSAFLIEMDGILSNSPDDKSGKINPDNFDSLKRLQKPVVVIATSYDIETIDGSLLRPGRLEEHLFMKLPDESSRQKIISSFLSRLCIVDLPKGSAEYESLIQSIVFSTDGW